MTGNMTDIDGNKSVPTDHELIKWGWKTNHVSQLRLLPPASQRLVLDEYIRRMMEGENLDNLDF